jgi:hypothetical protein
MIADARPKRGFPTRRDAQRARRQGHMDQHVYRCEPCSAYHLGHRP